MTHITFHGRSRSSAGLPGFATAIGGSVLTAFRWLGRLAAAEIDRRRTMQLLGADAHMLSDIGITRGDVYAAVMTGAGEMASERLARLRSERRAAQKAQASEIRHQG